MQAKRAFCQRGAGGYVAGGSKKIIWSDLDFMFGAAGTKSNFFFLHVVRHLRPKCMYAKGTPLLRSLQPSAECITQPLLNTGRSTTVNPRF